MSNFTYMVDDSNRFADATLSATSEATNYPIENAQALPISQPWRSTALSSQKILIDLTDAYNVNLVALINHNLTSGATVTLKAGAGADPDGSSYTSSMTWAEFVAWNILSSDVGYRYWSITITDASNSDGYIKIGYIMMGLKTTLDFQIASEWTKERLSLIRKVDNELGVPMVGREIGKGTRVNLSFVSDDQDEIIDVHEILKDLEGDPMFFSPDTTEAEAFFGRLEGNYSQTLKTGTYSLDVTLRTDHLGW